MIMDEMMLHVDMLSSTMMHNVFREIDGTIIITKDRNLIEDRIKIFKLIHDPKQSNTILSMSMYLDSVVESTTEVCFLLCQEINDSPSNW